MVKKYHDKEDKKYIDRVALCTAIAKPMAPRKLFIKIGKLITRAAAQKYYFIYGLKMVQKKLEQGHTGIVIFAGDVEPIDIMCHLPIVCEEKNIPYCFVPSRHDISAAMGYTKGCIVVLIKECDQYKKLYYKVKSKITQLSNTFFNEEI